MAPQSWLCEDAQEGSYRLSHPSPCPSLRGIIPHPAKPSNGNALNGSKPLSILPEPQKSSFSPLPPTQLPSLVDGDDEDDAYPLLLQQADSMAQPWENLEENLLGIGVTMQFALSRRMGTRTRWLIAGGGVALLLVSAIITILLSSVLGIFSVTQYGPFNLLVALTVPVIPAFFIHLLINFIDRYEREPWFLRLAAFLWGAIIAIPPAFLIEQNVGTFMDHIVGPNPLQIGRASCR